MYLIPLILCGALLLFVAIVLIRAALFLPKKKEEKEVGRVDVDLDRAVLTLSEMIKCKTVSHTNRALDDESEFRRFESILPELFPRVFEKCQFEKPGERSLLFRWKGKDPSFPTVLMAHYDVVPTRDEAWDTAPFEAVLKDSYLWGRGTLDTKGSLNGILHAAETLIAEDFVPERDIYFAFGGDEEVNGNGASTIVSLFKERGITPGAVYDEGGAVATEVFPGVNTPAALIGICEKGMVNIEYTVSGGGGHSSSPAPITPIGRLARAAVRVERHPFKLRITKPVAKLFDNLGRYSTFPYRVLFANLWCFSPLLSIFGRLSGGELNSTLRTTTAFTQMEGSKGMNVIPAVAKMVSNHRIIPGETVEDVEAEIKAAVKDKKVAVRVIGGMSPSVISSTECEAFERICDSVSETFEGAVVTPYLMVACSDSRHWGVICDKVYRFSPMTLSKAERATIHGNNERISLSSIAKISEFYIRIMKKS